MKQLNLKDADHHSNINDYLVLASDFMEAYSVLYQCVKDCTFSSEDCFVDNFERLKVAWSKAASFHYKDSLVLLPLNFRNEVAIVRQAFAAGDYEPPGELPFLFLRDYFSPFQSAFGFVECVSSQLWQAFCHYSWDIEQLDPVQSFKAIHAVGRLSGLIKIDSYEGLLLELKKETVAVEKHRSENKSWNFNVESLPKQVYELIGPKSPAEWEKVFGLSWKTIKNRIATGIIRAEEINSKSWKIAVEDIPK